MFKLLLLFLLLFSFPLQATETPKNDYTIILLKDWKALPVLHDGRLKPLDSFARIHLKQFSGRETVGRLSASQWLALSVFEAAKASHLPVFKVQDFESYNLPKSPQKLYSFLDVLSVFQSQQKTIDDLLKTPQKKWTPAQQRLIDLYSDANTYAKILEGNQRFSSDVSQHKKFQTAFKTRDQTLWDATVDDSFKNVKNPRLKIEYLYNLFHLLFFAGLFYGVSFATYLISSFFKNKMLEDFAFKFLSLGAIFNILDIAFRVYILNRPPIGTLYESILFVAATCALGFIYLEYKRRDTMGTLLGSITGILLILTAKSFAGVDTMGTLVAVLNTNFWLLTHVICITIGYGICFLVAMLAHYFLFSTALQPNKKELQQDIVKITKTLSIIALLFTTIGTILGGIWADQSWGRFWGWDPKENGALLIVLWLIWLLHGRISKHITETGFMVGSAFLSIVVVLAWFGVNLLSVGLHSYGFISGVATTLISFCSIEAILILGTWFIIYKKGQRDES